MLLPKVFTEQPYIGHSTPDLVNRYSHLRPEDLKGVTDCIQVGTILAQEVDSERAAL